jgi:hypothetical protein
VDNNTCVAPKKNGLSLARSDIQYTPRSVESVGVPWILGGIGRQLDGSAWKFVG